MTIVHSSGPWPYYPLRRDDPKAGLAADEAERLRAFVARAKSHNMRTLVGIMPLAPVEIVTPYFGASGTGQINAVFLVTPQAGAAIPRAQASGAEGYQAVSRL